MHFECNEVFLMVQLGMPICQHILALFYITCFYHRLMKTWKGLGRKWLCCRI